MGTRGGQRLIGGASSVQLLIALLLLHSAHSRRVPLGVGEGDASEETLIGWKGEVYRGTFLREVPDGTESIPGELCLTGWLKLFMHRKGESVVVNAEQQPNSLLGTLKK